MIRQIRFVASASTQAQTSYLSFRGDSPDPEVREYYASLSRPEGAKLLQVGPRPASYTYTCDVEGDCDLYEVFIRIKKEPGAESLPLVRVCLSSCA
jgi:hypothetical protein